MEHTGFEPVTSGCKAGALPAELTPRVVSESLAVRAASASMLTRPLGAGPHHARGPCAWGDGG
jgi:hypothetical protein